MGRVMIVLFLASLKIIMASDGYAHEPNIPFSGALHFLSDGTHYLGIIVMGAIASIYISLFGHAVYVLTTMVLFLIPASHLHAPIHTLNGFLFLFGLASVTLLSTMSFTYFFRRFLKFQKITKVKVDTTSK